MHIFFRLFPIYNARTLRKKMNTLFLWTHSDGSIVSISLIYEFTKGAYTYFFRLFPTQSSRNNDTECQTSNCATVYQSIKSVPSTIELR